MDLETADRISTTTLNRRNLVRAGAIAAAAPLLFSGFETSAQAADALPGLPAGITAKRAVYSNWDGTISTTSLWTCSPMSIQDLPDLANWAVKNGWRLRPAGYKHTWSPLTVEGSESADRVLLVDTTTWLTSLSMSGTDLVAQAGASMDSVLDFLATRGRGLTNIPAPGDVTIGGVIAVGGHGTSVPAKGETPVDGANFGSLANAVKSFRAVVWDTDKERFVLKKFSRNHPDAGALLVGLGRTFLAEVTVRTQPAETFSCVNTTSIHQDELFAHPASAGPNSLASLLDQDGRVGLIWYAFTEHPWVQRWKVTPERPGRVRTVTGAYNYPFADRLPGSVSWLVGMLMSGWSWMAPLVGPAILGVTQLGLAASDSQVMWGPAHYLQRFVLPSTLRVSAGSQALLTRRDRVQEVVHEFATIYTDMLRLYQSRGQFPVNTCVEIRVTGVDRPDASGVAGAQPLALSAGAPHPDHPDYDTVVWLDALTAAGTPGQGAFYAELERKLRDRLGPLGVLRPEWSKRFAHTASGGAWTNTEDFGQRIPAAFPQFAAAQEVFARYDPKGVFRSTMLGKLGL